MQNFIFFTLVRLLLNFYRASAYWRAILAKICPSVCPSIRYVPVSDYSGLTYCHSFFPVYGSTIILVLPASDTFTKFWRDHPMRGR